MLNSKVSPDSGGAKRATSLADALGCSFALIHKERRAKLAKNPPSTAASASSNKGPLTVISGGSIGMSSSTSVNTTANATTTMVATTMLVGDVKDKSC
ncbi:hypothetical protein QCA50_018720 [Cerrena zonata]|uniref:Uncharacterized protein n=1 Tax=Cerrena zonata TaxID=2478898 RepID=A0AAW0FJA5_9APHY